MGKLALRSALGGAAFAVGVMAVVAGRTALAITRGGNWKNVREFLGVDRKARP